MRPYVLAVLVAGWLCVNTSALPIQTEEVDTSRAFTDRIADVIAEGAVSLRTILEASVDVLERLQIPGLSEEVMDVRDYFLSAFRTYLTVLERKTVRNVLYTTFNRIAF